MIDIHANKYISIRYSIHHTDFNFKNIHKVSYLNTLTSICVLYSNIEKTHSIMYILEYAIINTLRTLNSNSILDLRYFCDTFYSKYKY